MASRSAVARLRLGDFQDRGEQRMLRFAEKGGKERQIPVRHDLEAWLRDYIESAGIEDEPKSSALFRPAEARRLKDAGLPELLSPHNFRVTVITDLLIQDVPLEDVQYLAGTPIRALRRFTTAENAASAEPSLSGFQSERIEGWF